MLVLVMLILTACQPAPGSALSVAITPTSQPIASISATVVATRTPAAFASPTVETPTATPTPQPTYPLCSPLEGIALDELQEIVSFPYDPPDPGKDDGHHGVDFSYYRRGDQKSIEGLPVRSVFAGRVAAAVTDRPPYGNMLIIETPLDLFSEDRPFLQRLPQPQPPLLENPRLTCPPVDLPEWDSPNRSLYLLYAHLSEPPTFDIGDSIECGQVIGAVGNTGMSGNPHLHLEARVGPGRWSFPSLAHYDNTASPEELGNYCLWRVSGLFQLIDPLTLLQSDLPEKSDTES